MNLTQLFLGVLVGAAIVVYYQSVLRKERRAVAPMKELHRVVVDMVNLDNAINRGRVSDESWMRGPEAAVLIRQRINAHEIYCDLLGHHPLREVEYVNSLMRSAMRTAQ